MRTQQLVSTGDKPDGWCFGGMSGSGVYELHIFRVVDGRIVNHPKWGNKRWKYRRYEDLEKIRAKCDQIGLLCGALKIYEPRSK